MSKEQQGLSTKHTPGPWYVLDPKNVGGLSNAFGDGPTSVLGLSHYPADARLIAAAPELLAALEGAVSLLEFVEPEVEGGYSPDGALSIARAAIAKAKGE